MWSTPGARFGRREVPRAGPIAGWPRCAAPVGCDDGDDDGEMAGRGEDVAAVEGGADRLASELGIGQLPDLLYRMAAAQQREQAVVRANDALSATADLTPKNRTRRRVKESVNGPAPILYQALCEFSGCSGLLDELPRGRADSSGHRNASR